MRVAEYFAGIGLARLGLEGAGLSVTWSNDVSAKKHAMYSKRFGVESNYLVDDVTKLTSETDPRSVDVAWASFPCTDLSLAGTRGGLNHGASAAFWGFINSIERMGEDRPAVVALENVLGFATSHGGADLKQAVIALNRLGYSVDILRIDARRFVPQSRVRLFLIADRAPVVSTQTPHLFRPPSLDWVFNDPSLRTHRYPLPSPPSESDESLGSLIDSISDHDQHWWDSDRVSRFLASLSEAQDARLRTLLLRPVHTYRSAYRRMRSGTPRWEIRADDIAGCLRTARGGSSRQAIVRVGNGNLDIRWMSPAEYAALMGATGFATTEMSASDAQWGFGDGVCVPVVKWLATHAIVPRLVPTKRQIVGR